MHSWIWEPLRLVHCSSIGKGHKWTKTNKQKSRATFHLASVLFFFFFILMLPHVFQEQIFPNLCLRERPNAYQLCACVSSVVHARGSPVPGDIQGQVGCGSKHLIKLCVFIFIAGELDFQLKLFYGSISLKVFICFSKLLLMLI